MSAPPLCLLFSPCPPSLREDDLTSTLDLWWCDLDQFASDALQQFPRWLHAEEQARVDRLVPVLARRRTLVMRGVLRWLLAGYLATTPEAVEFRYAAHGKPFVKGPAHGPPWRFNVSHSQNLGVIAVTGSEVGVDVEKRRDNLAMAALVERYFSPMERQRFRDLADSDRAAWFFRCWTRKEALLKACGLGIHMPLDEVDVGGEEREAVVTLQGTAWHVRDVSQGEGVASLAVSADGCLTIRRGVIQV